jgi:hypothetical protein
VGNLPALRLEVKDRLGLALGPELIEGLVVLTGRGGTVIGGQVRWQSRTCTAGPRRVESDRMQELEASADSQHSVWHRGFILGAALIVAVVLAAYGLSLNSSFTFDDFPFLVNNPSVTHFDGPLRILGDASTHSTGDVVQTYRPLRTLLFALEYRAFGRRAGFYHAVNLALHTLLALLLWQYGKSLVGERMALAASAMFACHPLGSEVVLSIKSQDDLLASIFVLAGLLLLPKRTEPRLRVSVGRAIWICVAYAMCLLSKESGAVFPLLLIAHFAIPRGRASGGPGSMRPVPLGLALSLAAVFSAYWVLRSHAIPDEGSGLPGLHMPFLLPSSLGYVPLYLKQFLFPLHLTIDYTSLAPLRLLGPVFIGSLLVQVVFSWAIWHFGRGVGRFGLVWFYVTLLPSLNIVPGVAVVFAERFVFLGMWGLVLILLEFCNSLLGRGSLRVAAARRTAIMVVIVIVLCGRAAVRSADWKDNESLFRSALRTNPSSEIFRVFLAKELTILGRHGEAEAELDTLGRTRIMVPVSALDRSVLETLGLKYLADEDYKLAAEIFRANTSSRYALDSDWLNYGTALTNLRQYDAAVQAFEKAAANRRYAGAAHRMLGRVCMERGDYGGAVLHMDTSCELESENPLGWYFSILCRYRQGLEAEAAERLMQARRAGIALGPLIREDIRSWDSASPLIRDIIESDLAREDSTR